ncbi:MAG: hypothetical protein Kow0099_20420 [Candidatus Abyssubacteria bacterium]
MSGYTKETFDRHLVAIQAELVRIEEEYRAWPEDLVKASSIVLKKAEELLNVCAKLDRKQGGDKSEILKKALEVGALALKFALEANCGSKARAAGKRDDFKEISSFAEA